MPTWPGTPGPSPKQPVLQNIQLLSGCLVATTKCLFIDLAATCSLNFSRYQQWSQQDSKPAGFAFDGPAYKALGLTSLDKAEVMYCQQHLRIVDGLYGLLRPLDNIRPYRLEMANKLNTNTGKTLYAYWGDLLTNALNR